MIWNVGQEDTQEAGSRKSKKCAINYILICCHFNATLLPYTVKSNICSIPFTFHSGYVWDLTSENWALNDRQLLQKLTITSYSQKR